MSARSDPFEAGKPIKITVLWNNTGRLLASVKVTQGVKFYTKEEWNDGRASATTRSAKDECMNGLPKTDNQVISTGVAYPTTGFTSYMLTYNSNSSETPEKNRVILTPALMGNDLILELVGCFLYTTGESATHHSFFCYYREAGISDDINNLTYCPWWQDAD